MFEKEFQEWFELNKKWLYSMDHVQAAYSAWCAGVKQQQAVEHRVQRTGLESATEIESQANDAYERAKAYFTPRR